MESEEEWETIGAVGWKGNEGNTSGPLRPDKGSRKDHSESMLLYLAW